MGEKPDTSEDPRDPYLTFARLIRRRVREKATLVGGSAAQGGSAVEARLRSWRNPMTAAGDLIVGTTGGAPQRLAVGTNNQVLTVVSGMPTWADGGGGANISAGPMSSRPAAGTAGRLYLCTDTPLICYDNGTVWQCWGSYDYPIAEPDNNAFSWAAQGYLNGATLDTSKGGIILKTPRTAAHNWAIRVVAAPSPPFTLIARIRPLLIGRSAQECGLVARNSATGAFIAMEVVATQSIQQVKMAKWTNATTFSADYDGGILPFPIDRPLWLRWVDDGTNRKGGFSYDGIYWHEIPSTIISRTDFTTPDQIGFGVNGNNNNVGTDPAVWLLGWEVS